MNPYLNITLPSYSPWLYVYRKWFALEGVEWVEVGAVPKPSCRVEIGDAKLTLENFNLECKLSYFMEDTLIATRVAYRSVTVDRNNIISLEKPQFEPVILYKPPHAASFIAFKTLTPWPLDMETIEKNMQLSETMIYRILSTEASNMKYFDWGIRGVPSTYIYYGLLEGQPIFSFPESKKIFYNAEDVAIASLLRSKCHGIVGPVFEEAFETAMQTTKIIDLKSNEQSAILDLATELNNKIEKLKLKFNAKESLYESLPKYKYR